MSRRLSPVWTSVGIPVTFDLRTQKVVMDLDLTQVPDLPMTRDSDGVDRFVLAGDEVLDAALDL